MSKINTLQVQLTTATATLRGLGVTKLAYDPTTIHLHTAGSLRSMLSWALGTIQHIQAPN